MKKQLKRELKQEITTKKTKPKRWFFYCLAALILAASLFPVYRKQQPAASLQLLAQGVKLESQGRVVAAESIYQEVYRRYPQAQEAAEALLRIGKLWQYDLNDEQVALLNYLKLEHDYPESPLVLPSREEAARIMKQTLHDYSRAIEFYQYLLGLNAGTPDQYYYEIADCYFHLENYPQARIELETLLEKYPQSLLVPNVLYRKGGLYLLEGNSESARQDWQNLIETYPESPYRVLAEFDLAKQLEEEGLLDKALRRYKVLKGFSQPSLLQEKIEHLEQRIADKEGTL